MSFASAPERPTSPPPLTTTRRTVLDAANLGAAATRIPALLRCRDGRITAFAEVRYDGPGDSGQIDVVATTSADGHSWTTPLVVVSGEGGTRGNPVPIEASNGDIVLLTTSNAASVSESEILAGGVDPEAGRRVHVTRMSADLSRIDPSEEITDRTKQPGWRWYATGPGHGLRLRCGRLVAAANHSVVRPTGDGSPYGAHGLISDDDGRSWRISWITPGFDGASGPNESALAHDPASPDETIVTFRNENRDEPQTRAIARTRGGCADLVEYRPLRGFAGPRLQVGLATKVDSGLVLLSSPLHDEARRDLVLHVVEGGACRPAGLLLSGPAGYSDLAVGPDAVHVLVETGDERAHERIDLITIDLPTVLRAAGHPEELHP